jgi:muramoyltetrapeptide carboxypeptidase
MTFPLPRPVTRGSRLAVVATAGPFNEETFQKGISWLSERYEIIYRADIFSKYGYLAGADDRRLVELTDALIDPDIDAVVCARGGFGVTRILPGLDLNLIRRANKMIIGFSDITALHARWYAAGVRSVHAPMVAALANASESIREKWITAVEHSDTPLRWKLTPLNDVEPAAATGRLTGGNLAVLSALNGTPYAPDLNGAILFLEDVGERPYRVDRMLTSLAQAGCFDHIAGLIIGAFTEGDPGPDGVAVEEVIQRQFANALFPVLTGFPAGHIDENEPIPFGSLVTIRENTLETAAPAPSESIDASLT